MTRLAFVVTLTALTALSLGCVSPRSRRAEAQAQAPQQIATPADRPTAEAAERIQADPLAYLRDVLARADALDQYRLTFYRQERLGGRLRSMERINALFRKQPFSVKFVWPDPQADYFESVYVAGQNDNKLVVRERKGALPLVPPTTRKLDPMAVVQLGRSRNPITQFGLGLLARRTVTPFDDPAIGPGLTIRYQGMVNLDPQNRPAHHFLIEHPPMPGLEYIRQDFYVDAETQLPAGTDLYEKPGQLEARYRYADIDPNVNLTDADFQLSRSSQD
ncbi:MAG TPA: DUF1571 domain-containing protein [Phycisphaerae bacterium]|nr:DUF1571 domain-containing protein [Phycisphaerae bacterium]HOB75773.1 DUF1571 domain-containing protein [Phycisphaerae bacterium]HOJ55595.1 DUF1571 domain-containing protein [Phycisphaerae bacterium]HOL27709.1 DUF1571 domain-containing protein [Phycisphaerae bacterium]HPP21909.1 DUF1571 domain-containing protein [Phycisphaerae bacterium]